jgi:hypothetical protein
MKTFTKISLMVFAMILATQVTNAQQQIPFKGLVSQGFGAAVWNADGTGPEPAATGHQVPFPGFGNLYYYGASRDYISGNPDHAAFHFLPGMTGFPEFEQALNNNGFKPGQLKVKVKLVTAGEDIEGLDWFVIDNHHYSNHYNTDFNIFELGGEPMLAFQTSHSIFKIHATSTTWFIETSYGPVKDISQNSSAAVQAAAAAFINDLNGKEVRMTYESTYSQSFSGNGRNGSFYNILNGVLEVGNPTFPFTGLYADNEGFAGWDADGTGPEPYGNGHLTQRYYIASVDYDGINPNPDACLGHFLDGSTGFLNTLLQLQYRGVEIGDLKMKLGLNSLGPDVQGEDWGYENGQHWCNYYNNHLIFELNGEPILKIMADTNKVVSMSTYYKSGTSVGKVYDISENATPGAQFVAQSFLKDMGTHYLSFIADTMLYVTLFNGNGRDGAIYQIPQGKVVGVHKNISFVPAGEVSGTWATEGSPYYVDGHLEIDDGETLIIEPGVKVAVRGPYRFNVQGCVIAEGTEDEKIIFTRSNPNLMWDGFDYDYTPTDNDSSLFNHCIFEYGSALGSAPANCGGVFAIRLFDKLKIENSIFRSNQAINNNVLYNASGGAIALWNASPLIQKCIFYDNYAWEYAGAIFVYQGSNPIISNCLFYNNTSKRGGAISFYLNGKGMLINNTIADNFANLYGGAIYLYSGSSPQIINNIIWNNQANAYGNQVYNSGANNLTGYFYNNIEGGISDFGGTVFSGSYLFNLEEDPSFTYDPVSPYMISGSSPCYNAGTPDTSAWYYPEYLPETCLCGNPRICDGRIDLGAFEWLLTGIRKTNEANMALQIHPNPVNDFVYVEFNLPQTSLVSIQIINAMGAMVTELHHGQLPAGQQQFTWHAGHLPKGLYLCRVQVGEETRTLKIVKN